MLDTFKSTLVGQYEFALSMFEDCIRQCSDEQWDEDVGNFPFWHVAFHALFYTDLYLSSDLESFEPPTFYRENYQYFGRLPYPPHEPFVADIPYDKETILAYVGHCRRKVPKSIEAETTESLQGPCGFWWYEIPRAEFHLNNIRHLQHHTAQLGLYLRQTANVGIGWAGTGR